MDLSKLDKADRVAARLYLRRRKRAWNHFYFLQDLKQGNMIIDSKERRVLEVKLVDENYTPLAIDIVVICQDIRDGTKHLYAFSIMAYEAGFLEPYLRVYNKGVGYGDKLKNSILHDLLINPATETLYGK